MLPSSPRLGTNTLIRTLILVVLVGILSEGCKHSLNAKDRRAIAAALQKPSLKNMIWGLSVSDEEIQKYAADAEWVDRYVTEEKFGEWTEQVACKWQIPLQYTSEPFAQDSDRIDPTEERFKPMLAELHRQFAISVIQQFFQEQFCHLSKDQIERMTVFLLGHKRILKSSGYTFRAEAGARNSFRMTFSALTGQRQSLFSQLGCYVRHFGTNEGLLVEQCVPQSLPQH